MSASAPISNGIDVDDVLLHALSQIEISDKKEGTGIMYDERCLLHADSGHHWENPLRLDSIIKNLKQTGTMERCVMVPARVATTEELCSSGKDAVKQLDKLKRMESRLKQTKQVENLDSDTYVNEHTLLAAKLSVGGLIELTDRVLRGEIKNGFALTRPPGHHADNRSSSGFCIFNSVALAVQDVRRRHPDMKIAIVDVDYHFGDGTASVFSNDPNVLYMSIHQHMLDGNFVFPGKCGAKTNVGKKNGKGFTINVPINVPDMGDHEYMLAFKEIFLPILDEFKPTLVFISAGFDCADSDPLTNTTHVSSSGFANMTAAIRDSLSSNQHMIMALEGGYGLKQLAEGVNACVKVLLGDSPPELPDKNWFMNDGMYIFNREAYVQNLESNREKFAETVRSCRRLFERYWACFASFSMPELQ